MATRHTVEKIGGTSMSRFDEVLKNIFIGNLKPGEYYNRIFVVSAYGGITDMLLENKKTGAPGVYTHFMESNEEWYQALEAVREKMLNINKSFQNIGLDPEKADAFVNERVEGVKRCLQDVLRVRSYGHLTPENYLNASREFLSALGEAHSAYNTSLILQANGISSRFVDLTGWKETQTYPIETVIDKAFQNIDLTKELPIVTGYTKCTEGMMNLFDRGYSEITFSKLAVVTEAVEGIIHKEYHLCTGDPAIFGSEKIKVIGNTNFDIADQLADMDMEAIHSCASKEMEVKDISIRVKNTFDPEHPGTLISRDYISPNPRVDMICGRDDISAVEVIDSDMVGTVGYDYKLLQCFNNCGISYIAKNTNANTITHYFSADDDKLKLLIETLQKEFPNAKVSSYKVAIVCVIGTNMAIPGILSKASNSLASAGINVLALDQCLRQVNLQFVVDRDEFKKAQLALHKELVEDISKKYQ